MFKFACCLPVALVLISAEADGAKNWLRYPAISPDGKHIAFSFRGDLWVVASTGGTARLLTTHQAYEKSPVWSRDSKHIAFASDRHGNFDVFLVSAAGGPAKRITYHSANDTPTAFSHDGKRILFTSFRQDSHKAVIGHASMGELYSISSSGGRARQILTTPAEDACPSPDGRLIAYHDYKGYEDVWRKHHVSSVARDIWVYDTNSKKHTRITSFRGEDREPVISSNGRVICYLSEKSGTFNVWRMVLGDATSRTQVTKHKTHPVRFLSISNNHTLAYSYNGEIWTKKNGQSAQQVEVKIAADHRSNPIRKLSVTSGATEFAVSPNQEEIAFVSRGEVFVTSVDYPTTKRITNTPQQERSVSWSKDGKTLYYAGERNGSWNIYKSRIKRKGEDRFSSATLLVEESVIADAHETFQPVVSPDGKKIAYLQDRDEIRVYDIATKKSKTLVPETLNYSYTDGDITYRWSPDSKWLAFMYVAKKRWGEDVGIANVESGKITEISNSGYSDRNPVWSPDGKALLFLSDELGRRNHGSWGSDDDIFGFYLTRESYQWINFSKEELKRWKKEKEKAEKDKKKKEEDKKDKDKKDGEKPKAEKKDKKPKPIKIDLRDTDFRRKRLTLHSAPIGGYAISPDGETVVYFAQVDSKWGLWVSRIRSKGTSKLASAAGSGSVVFAKDGKSVFSLSGGKLSKITVPPSGSGTAKPIAFSAEMRLDTVAERQYIFEHAWRQVKKKFYRPELHGVDWELMKKNYEQFLPTISTNREFADVLGEMLGELNASHTGGKFRSAAKGGDSTPHLGVLFDLDYRGAGLKVAEVLRRGPADKDGSKIKPGVRITHIDGEELTATTNPNRLLNGKAGKKVLLGLADGQKTWEEIIKPISGRAASTLLYERWVRGRQALVEKLSNGRVGYVHVKSMNDASFRRFYKDTLGANSDKDALIVDTRYNGGGWLHDHLVSFLSGKDYIHFKPRGKKLGQFGAEPAFRWSRPSVVVQSESNYSDAHMFPFAYKQLKIGKLVGTPVPGTGTAVWWERQINPEIIFGIPQVGMVTPDGKYLENLELKPDVEVYNTPESVAAGKDLQIEKAVKVLLDDLKSKAR